MVLYINILNFGLSRREGRG